MNGDSGIPNPRRSPSSQILDTGNEYLAVTKGPDQQTTISRYSPGPEYVPTATAGLVDLQVNGFAGIDFNNGNLSANDMDHALGAMLATGVTTCLPTIITASEHCLRERLMALDQAVTASELGPRMVPGYHLEGPFLNPKPGYAGCHPPQEMVLPSVELLRRLEQDLARPILYLTLAPELDRAPEIIHWAASQHKIVGAGHSAVTQKSLSEAIAAGLSVATHLGNGVAQVLPKFDNPVQWQLAEDRVTGCFIADGVHIPAPILKSLIRAKGINRSVLVTDAMAAAAAPAGTYSLAGMAVESNDAGVVNLKDSPLLAGSALTMGKAVANITRWGIADFRSALRMACANPLGLLAPVLKAHDITINLGELEWGHDGQPLKTSLGYPLPPGL